MDQVNFKLHLKQNRCMLLYFKIKLQQITNKSLKVNTSRNTDIYLKVLQTISVFTSSHNF